MKKSYECFSPLNSDLSAPCVLREISRGLALPRWGSAVEK